MLNIKDHGCFPSIIIDGNILYHGYAGSSGWSTANINTVVKLKHGSILTVAFQNEGALIYLHSQSGNVYHYLTLQKNC